MILCHSRKFIFIHLHKTAGESVTLGLRPHLARGDLVLGTTLPGELNNAWYNRRYKLQKHSGARKVRSYVGPEIWNGYLKFAFVRDPVDRARSLFFYYEKMLKLRRQASLRNALVRLPGMEFRDIYRWPGMQAFLESASFSEFIRHPKFSPTQLSTRRQSDMLCDADGRLLVDVVGKYETLQEDFATIAARLGLPEATLPWRNPSRNREAAEAPVDPADRAWLAEIYRRDYETFGYPLPPTPGGRALASLPGGQATDAPTRPASRSSK